jgi:DNA repair exonuclease SbcCD ATPase subunit
MEKELDKDVQESKMEKKLEDMEVQIRELRGKIQELESALEREKNEEKAQVLKDALKEHRQKLERLMAEFRKTQKPRGESSEIEMAIDRTRGQLKELRHAAEVLKKESAEPEKLEAMQKEIAQKERELEELIGRLEKRRAEAEPKKAKAPAKLVILSLEHANAQNLSKVIEKFLTPSGIIAADADTNSLVIKDLPAGLEIASKIIKELDVPKKRKPQEPQVREPQAREPQERAASREGVLTGKVLEAGAEALKIETGDGKITLYVPLRQKEDGTWTQLEELSRVTAAIEVGSTVKVEWRRSEEKLWIKRVTKVEK